MELGNTANAVDALLEILKIARIRYEDIFITWGFLRELGYQVPEDKANLVLGVILRMPVVRDQQKGVIQAVVYGDGAVFHEESMSLGGSAVINTEDYRDEARRIVELAQKAVHIFSSSSESTDGLDESLMVRRIWMATDLPESKAKLVILLPSGKRECMAFVESLQTKKHPAGPLFHEINKLINKIEKRDKGEMSRTKNP